MSHWMRIIIVGLFALPEDENEGGRERAVGIAVDISLIPTRANRTVHEIENIKQMRRNEVNGETWKSCVEDEMISSSFDDGCKKRRFRRLNQQNGSEWSFLVYMPNILNGWSGLVDDRLPGSGQYQFG
ncbi:unnamed protein product, partial [Acanthocheilonema viteae]